jgi:bacteriorhodopsin
LTGYLLLEALQQRARLERFDRQDGADWNIWTATIFFFGILSAFLSQQASKTVEKRQLSGVLFTCCTIACATYLLMAYNLSPALRSPGGTPTYFARYIEWIVCCPVLIGLIGEITKSTKKVGHVILADYIMIICGFSASIIKEPYSTFFGWAAIGCFFLVIQGLYDMYTDAMDKKTDSALSFEALRQARFVTVLAWCGCIFD